MGKSLAIASMQILSLLLLASMGQSKRLLTNLTLYDHEYRSGDAQSLFPVAGLPNKTWGLDQFATVFVFDNTLTENISPSSHRLGHVQGIAAVSSVDKGVSVLLTIRFTSGQYNRSTVEVKGLNVQPLDVDEEYAIVGGTRQFRGATGHLTLDLVHTAKHFVTFRLSLYIKQDI